VWLERIARGLHHLHGKRGPLLVQLPPQMERDHDRLAIFWARFPPGYKSPSSSATRPGTRTTF
jgi:uncharacterized protein YecE (DUF72 family)